MAFFVSCVCHHLLLQLLLLHLFVLKLFGPRQTFHGKDLGPRGICSQKNVYAREIFTAGWIPT